MWHVSGNMIMITASLGIKKLGGFSRSVNFLTCKFWFIKMQPLCCRKFYKNI